MHMCNHKINTIQYKNIFYIPLAPSSATHTNRRRNHQIIKILRLGTRMNIHQWHAIKSMRR